MNIPHPPQQGNGLMDMIKSQMITMTMMSSMNGNANSNQSVFALLYIFIITQVIEAFTRHMPTISKKIASRLNNDDFYHSTGINERKNAEALKPKMDITEVNKIYEEIKLADPVASEDQLLFRNKIREMATHKITEIDATASFAKNYPKSHSDREAFFNKSEKLPEPIAGEKHEHHVSSYIGKEAYEKIIQKSRDDTPKPEEFTPLNIYNGTPGGRLNRDLRATLPINELKGNPLSEGCPILNLHRCNDCSPWNSSSFSAYQAV